MSIEWKDGRLDLAYRDLKALSLPFLETYTADATYLDLTGNFFADLPWLSEFRILKTLIVDDNKIHSASKLGKIRSLHTLCVNRNLIEDLDHFLNTVCKCFPNIRYLSMLHNTACPNFLNQGSLRQYNEYRGLEKKKSMHKLPFQSNSSKVTDAERQSACANSSPTHSSKESEIRSSVRFSESLDTDDPSIVQRRQAYNSEPRLNQSGDGQKATRRRSSTRKITVPSSQSATNSPSTQPANSLASSQNRASHSTPNSPLQAFSNHKPDLTSKGVLLTSHLNVGTSTSYMEEVADPPVVNRFHRPSVDETSLSLQIALSLRRDAHKDLFAEKPEPPPLVLPEVAKRPLVLVSAALPPPPPPPNPNDQSDDDWSDGD